MWWFCDEIVKENVKKFFIFSSYMDRNQLAGYEVYSVTAVSKKRIGWKLMKINEDNFVEQLSSGTRKL